MTTPALSVVLPTHNRWKQLSTALDALSRQTVPLDEIEVIVVSDGSTDETDEALTAGRSPIPVTLIKQANQGPAVARNNGAKAAAGELILFIDDDVVADPGCIAAHMATHDRSTGPTVVIGPLLTPTDWTFQPWVLWEQRMLEAQYEAMAAGEWSATARQFYTGNASLPHRLFTASGGFDPTFLRGEDVELAYRLADTGTTFVFEFEARSHHYAKRSYDSWLAIAAAYGRNDAMMWRDHGRSWLVPTVRRELNERNPLTQAYTRLGLRSRIFADLAAKAAPPLTRMPMGRLGDRVTQATLSAVYNLTYYRALAAELGGRREFLAIEPAILAKSKRSSVR